MAVGPSRRSSSSFARAANIAAGEAEHVLGAAVRRPRRRAGPGRGRVRRPRRPSSSVDARRRPDVDGRGRRRDGTAGLAACSRRGYIATYGRRRAHRCAPPRRRSACDDATSSTSSRDQPKALARLLERQRAEAERVAALFRRDDVQYVLIASRGSSSNAARYAQYLLGRAHRVPVVVRDALALHALRAAAAARRRARRRHLAVGRVARRRRGRRGGEPAGPADGRAHELSLVAPRRRRRRGAAARGGRGAGGRGDEDLRQLPRRDRAAFRHGDR